MILSVSASELQGFDCAVVGAGPVGLSFALESARAGRKVLLVDAGNLRSSRRPTVPLGRSPVILDPARHAPIELTVRRGLGGTSWLWGGRCVSFEPIDFEDRPYVPGSRWPIAFTDIAPFRERAAEYLDCGAATFSSERPDWVGLGDFRMSNLERWARQPRLTRRLGGAVAGDAGIAVLLDARLTDLELAEDGSVRALVVERSGQSLRVQAADYVLAMGGLEITSFLLAQQRRRPDSFGGPGGPLGRFYMGHATGAIADIVLDDPARMADLDFERDPHDTYVRRRFTLTEEAQRRQGVLNTAFYLDNPPFYEVEHRNATLSLVFLALAIPPIGRRIIAEGIRLRHIGPPPYRYAQHLGNVLRQPVRAVRDIVDVLARRYLSPVRKPGFILRNAGGRYALHYHAEQLPNPDSRIVSEGDGQDATVRIDYRFQDQDIDSLLRCHALLDEALRTSGIGRLEYLAPDAEGVRAMAWQQATDGFHSIGTTRMSADPGDGVVDADCRVHGIANLYIGSSSVFRTSAEANPRFMAVCLAVRLARLLAGSGRPGATAPAPVTASVTE